MSNVEQHISELLMQHNCVVVPRFGGFVGSYQSAVIIEDSGIIKPPHKEIIFNKALSHNDGLLINTYSRRFEISYAEAEREVSSFVDELLAKVSKGEIVQVAEIGVFRADLLGNIYFIQSEGTNFLAESFGFDSLHLMPLTLSERNSQRFESRRKVFVRMIANRRVAATVAAAVAMFLFSTEILVKDVNSYSYGSLLSDFTPTMVQANLPKQVLEQVSEQKSVTIVEPILETKEKRPFHLIAASLKTKQEANEMLAFYIKNGCEDSEIVEADGRFRISIEQFGTKDLALKSMNHYRENNRYKSVWVFKQ